MCEELGTLKTSALAQFMCVERCMDMCVDMCADLFSMTLWDGHLHGRVHGRSSCTFPMDMRSFVRPSAARSKHEREAERKDPALRISVFCTNGQRTPSWHLFLFF